MIDRLGFTLKVLFLVAVCPIVALAQNNSLGRDDTSACITSAGTPGLLFRGYAHTLVGPKVFDSIRLTAADGSSYIHETTRLEDVYFIDDVRLGNQILVFAKPSAKTDQQTVIEFLGSSGEPLQTCSVTIVEYNASKHNISETVVGYCDFGEKNGVTYMTVEQVRTIDLPERMIEGSSPFFVLEYKTEWGGRQVTFTAKSPGLAFFVWLGASTGNGKLRGVCPFITS